jgi:hypothetical protein
LRGRMMGGQAGLERGTVHMAEGTGLLNPGRGGVPSRSSGFHRCRGRESSEEFDVFTEC